MEKHYRTRPFAKRSLGQNFLVDPRFIERIVAQLDLEASDTVVEIGPGRGALTERLVQSDAAVLAIELDRRMIEILADRFGDQPNFRIFEMDALEADLQTILSAPHSSPLTGSTKLIGNLPYYISTAILQKLIVERMMFSQMVLMLQKEVVERITAPPGSSDRGFLTVLIEAYFRVERLFDVPPDAFKPQPNIWSSVVRLVPLDRADLDSQGFRRLVSSAFAQKRKTILNNLKNIFPNAGDALRNAGIDPARRSETLTLDEWLMLTKLFEY
jgi:16S rRNA (adenine1518-N6/adenine1519-N6)-dimethyltransferase